MIIPYPYIPKREVPGKWGESFLILSLSQWGRPPLLQAAGKTISCQSQWWVTIPH